METGINGVAIGAGVVGVLAVRAAVAVFGFDTVAMILMLAGLVGMLLGVAVWDRWPSAGLTVPAALAVNHAPVADRGRVPLRQPRG